MTTVTLGAQPDPDMNLGPCNLPALGYQYAGQLVFLGSSNSTSGVQASSAPLVGGTSRQYPVSTMSAANALVRANRGDIVYMLPDYAETFTGAAGWAGAKVGVNYVGLSGNGTRRPTVTFTTAVGASCDITAAGVSISNVRFVNGIDAQTAMINVQAADVTLDRIEVVMQNAGATTNALIGILTTAAADRFTLKNSYVHGGVAEAVGAGTLLHTTGVRLVGGDGIKILNTKITGRFTTTLGALSQITTATTNITIDGVIAQNTSGSATRGMNFATAGCSGTLSNSAAFLGNATNVGIAADGGVAFGTASTGIAIGFGNVWAVNLAVAPTAYT